MKISRRRLADYVKTLQQKACCTYSTIIFLHSTNQIIDLCRCLWRCRRILNSLLGKRRRLRLRLRQRHEARILLVEGGKVHVLPVKHQFPCISLPYSTNNNVKSPNLRFLRQHEHITMKQSFSVLTLKTVRTIQLQHNSTVSYKVNKKE